MERNLEYWSSNRGVPLLVRRAHGAARLRGLIGRPPPGPACALLLPGCRSVHGFAMRYAIDVVFLDARLRVLRVQSLKPSRLLVCWAAAHTAELRSGECDRLGIASGDRFELQQLRDKGVNLAEPAT